MRKGKRKTIEVQLEKKPYAGWLRKNHFESLEKLEELLQNDFLKELETEIELHQNVPSENEENQILFIL